jgi:hypothetical protein
MKDLLGNNADDNGEVLKMWQEGMQEYACPLGRITYEDFRMILKGQGREGEETSSRRRSSYKKITEGSPLQAVPEGSMSPQAKHSVFAKFEDVAALDFLKMPTLGEGQEGEKKKQDANIHFPVDVTDDVPPGYKRTRSGSLGYSPAPIIWHDPDEIMPNPLLEEMDIGSPMPRRSSHVVLRNRVIDGHDFIGPQMASDGSQEAFRKHHEFQKSVLEASKKFEQKVMARKMEIAATEASQTQGTRRASLVMKRGSTKMRAEVDQTVLVQPKSDQPENAGPIQPASDRQDTREKQVADASRRSGRPGRERRRRTNSDISGMLR